MQKEKKSISLAEVWGKIYPHIKECLVPTGIITLIWLILSWLSAAGISWGILRFVAFLTGAYNGNGYHVIGGTIGKAIYIMCINNLFVSVAVSKKTPKEKLAAFKDGIKDDVLKKIPQYSNFKYFFEDKDTVLLGSGALGVGFALLIYPVITAGGALVNTSVCLLLSAVIFKGLSSNEGLIMALVHLLLRQKPFKGIRKDSADRFLSGAALGMALSVVVAFCSKVRFFAVLLGKILPWALVAAGLVGIFFIQLKAFYDTVKSGKGKGESGK